LLKTISQKSLIILGRIDYEINDVVQFGVLKIAILIFCCQDHWSFYIFLAKRDLMFGFK